MNELLVSIRYFLPETILVIEALIILLAVLFKGKKIVSFLALMGLTLAFLLLVSTKIKSIENRIKKV